MRTSRATHRPASTSKGSWKAADNGVHANHPTAEENPEAENSNRPDAIDCANMLGSCAATTMSSVTITYNALLLRFDRIKVPTRATSILAMLAMVTIASTPATIWVSTTRPPARR